MRLRRTKNVRPSDVTEKQEQELRRVLRSAYEGIAHDMGDSDPEDRIEPTVWAARAEGRHDPKVSYLLKTLMDGSEDDWTGEVARQETED